MSCIAFSVYVMLCYVKLTCLDLARVVFILLMHIKSTGQAV